MTDSLTPVYDIADEFVRLTSCSVFITGKAGTGKTTFLHRLRERCGKQMAVLAPTGVAAINAGGMTLHSFFQLPFSPFLPTEEGRRAFFSKHRMNGVRRKVLRELEMLVIDEVSMVRADIMDEVDAILRRYRYRPDEPFGGVQMVFIGDLFQLSPVVPDEEWQLLSSYYDAPYFFHSRVIRQHPPLYLEFDRVFRQSNSDFVRLLNEVRNGSVSLEGMRRLASRYQPDFDLSEHRAHIILTTHNRRADAVNGQEMARLKGKRYVYTAKVRGVFPERNYPNEPELALKKGARVMFVSNDSDPQRRFYNGRIGRVTGLNSHEIRVLCDGDKDEILVPLEVWSNVRYTVNPESKQLEEEELGTYTQYPLRLAWAITIHKSQGLTFDKVVVDAESAFAPGQVYVALSRCTSLEGLVLMTPIHRKCLATDSRVTAYTRDVTQPLALLQRHLDESKRIYRQRVLLSVYDLRLCAGLAQALADEGNRDEMAFNGELRPYLSQLLEKVQELQRVGDTFQRELQRMFVSEPASYAERMRKAGRYFSSQWREVVRMIRRSPAQTDDELAAERYNEAIEALFEEVCWRRRLMEKAGPDADAAFFFDMRRRFKAPRCPVDAYVDPYEEILRQEKGKRRPEKSDKA